MERADVVMTIMNCNRHAIIQPLLTASFPRFIRGDVASLSFGRAGGKGMMWQRWDFRPAIWGDRWILPLARGLWVSLLSNKPYINPEIP